MSNWLTHAFGQFTLGWVLISSVVGGAVGAGLKFLFEGLLTPRLTRRREARRLIDLYTAPLTRSAEALERLINNHVRNFDRGSYEQSPYFRLSTLYNFGEYLAWIKLIERDFGFVDYGSSRRSREFSKLLNGLFKALTSFAYFRWVEGSVDIPDGAVEGSRVPRNMLRAIGEAMVDDSGERRTKEFTQFVLLFEKDDQFARWFRELDVMLLRAEQGNLFARDRLIAAGANLRALVVFLDPHNRANVPRHMENRKRIAHDQVRAALEEEFPQLLDQGLRRRWPHRRSPRRPAPVPSPGTPQAASQDSPQPAP